MIKKSFIVVVVAVLVGPDLLEASCVGRKPVTPEFCTNPPVDSNFVPFFYQGRWFQTFASGDAVRISPGICTAANYTLNADGSIAVKNCFLPPGRPRPLCFEGFAAGVAGGAPGQLSVAFPPLPPGPYNVAALLGNANYGYAAAAVYTCEIKEGRPVEGLFILARTPFTSRAILRKLAQKLRCRGFSLEDKFVPGLNGPDCKYFSGPEGFDIGRNEFGS